MNGWLSLIALALLATALAWWLQRRKALPAGADAIAGLQARLDEETARRVAAERGLLEAEQNLAVTLSSIGAGFIATDRAGLVTRMNDEAERILGWTQAEAQGQSVWQVFRREGRPQAMLARNPVDVLLQQGVSIQLAHHVVALARDGRRTEVEVKAEVTRDDAGQLRGMAVVLRDRTPQLQAAATASRLAAIVESSNDAIISKTLDGRITSWNHAAAALFGYPAVEAIGQPVQMLFPPDRLDEELRILAELARGRRVPTFETVRLRRDGTPVEVSVSILPVRDAQGRIVGASKIVTDLTQRREVQSVQRQAQLLEAENRQIQQTNRLKSQFLANMSHELRTPLNAVIGFAELLQSGRVPSTSPKHAEFLGYIAVSGRHLLQLINDVLDLSKVDSGKFEVHPEPVRLAALLQEVMDVQRQAVDRKGLTLSLDVDPALDIVELDPARLKQALFNYVSNAIKFTPEGGRIAVRAQAEGVSRFRIEVQDSGIGIAAHDLPRLFTEFQQLDAGLSKQHAGTGLGLALTRRLIEAQGGQVGARSELGQGSVFFLALERKVPVGTADGTRRRLLVVSDQVDQREQLVGGLSASGLRVDAAASAREGFERARSQSYHGLTLDLSLPLPDQPGLGLLGRIRGDTLSREAPVLGLTWAPGVGGSGGLPVADVLSKPLSTQEVVLAMSRLPVPPGRAVRVLVIDDDPMALDLMGATLGAMGVTWRSETDVARALSQLDIHRPDAIVLDLMMPGLDGFEALDRLRRMPAWQATPVFIWTSLLLTDQDVARLMRSASGILQKGGGSLDELMDALRRARSLAVQPDALPGA
jgi:PAS domain S-box-containing protein